MSEAEGTPTLLRRFLKGGSPFLKISSTHDAFCLGAPGKIIRRSDVYSALFLFLSSSTCVLSCFGADAVSPAEQHSARRSACGKQAH